MSIYDIYSKRQKRLKGDTPDVYKYDTLPSNLKTQIIYIWQDAIGGTEQYYHNSNVVRCYTSIVKILCREYGLFKLTRSDDYNDRHYMTELISYFLSEKNINKQLDVVELTFQSINTNTREYRYLTRYNSDKIANKAIEELNQRFKEHGIGFQFIENEIIRVDSELLHTEAVKPALRLLNNNYYKGAQEEFLVAYEHYRCGNHKDSLNNCLKAFESTMKSICNKQRWDYPQNITSKGLIQICLDNGLIPLFWQHQMTSLRTLLESSIPTGRNKLSGHGQGSELIEIPEHLVAYMLHMTASTLVFLTTAEATHIPNQPLQ